MKTIYQILLLPVFLFINNSYSSEKKDPKKKNIVELIIIKNILTQIQAPLVLITPRILQGPSIELFITNIYFCEPPKTLISLWNQQINFHTKSSYMKFCPTIIRYEKKGHYSNLGSLDTKKHKEAKAACNLGQSVYIPCQQGIIIYSLKHKIKENDTICKNIVEKYKDICEMVFGNQRKAIGA